MHEWLMELKIGREWEAAKVGVEKKEVEMDGVVVEEGVG